MSGYDISSRVPFRLLKGRLGVYDKFPFDPDSSNDEDELVLRVLDPAIEGVKNQYTRMNQAGGNLQQERMIKDKRRSLDRAIWNSYQAAEVVKIDAESRIPVRALINPNKLKPDYDDKIISVGNEFRFAPGTVFEWIGTNTFWLVYLQDLTELAYFRGDIRRCSYEISWEDDDGKHSTYAAVKGPVETKINFIQKHGISVDTPNYSLNILMPKNEETLAYFKRYSKFYLQGDSVCWRVEAIDWISTPGILEVVAVEYYANETEDDINNGIVGGNITPLVPNTPEEESTIIGETFIKVKKSYTYRFNGRLSRIWTVDPKYPVKIELDKNDPRNVTVTWLSSYSGQFKLCYGDISKTIVVESLF